MHVDAVLVLGFGGPERPADVLPFLANVTRGRGVPLERLAEVAEHYYALGGRSPINDQNRALVAALRGALDVPVYWGNRNWAPYVESTVAEMAAAGVRHAAGVATAAYAGFSSCRQYRDDIDRARSAVGPAAPRVTKVRHFFDQPGFVEPMAGNVRAALATLPADRRGEARLVCTAHSVPLAMAERAGPRGGAYVGQLRETARLVADRAMPGAIWDLVWQSRSGAPATPWLAPDVGDHLEALAREGTRAVVVAPVGFVSDHVEVLHDLDEEAASRASAAGLAFARAATVGTAPAFVAMIRELVAEIGTDRPPAGLGDPTLRWAQCPAGCCGGPGRPAG